MFGKFGRISVYRKNSGPTGIELNVLVSLILLVGLLVGCTPVQPEKVEQPQPQGQSSDSNDQGQTAVAIYPTLTAAPAFIAGCTNVKSAQFNIGASVGNRICLEGIVNKINIDSQNNRATIEFDTSTSSSGGSLYSVTILVQDVKSFGPDSLNQLVLGDRIAVNGLFGTGSSHTYVAAFIIEISQASDLTLIG